MALGKRSSENQVPTFGAPPPTPPPMPTLSNAAASAGLPPEGPLFGDTAPTESAAQTDVVTALDAKLRELQATVAALIEKPVDSDNVAQPPPVVYATASQDLDPDVQESSRILQLAKRTAETLMTEAREEATEIVRQARQRADEELDEQRRTLTADQNEWELRRRALIELFEVFDGALGSLRAQMDRAHEMIRGALDGPINIPISTPTATSTVEPRTAKPPMEEQPLAESPRVTPVVAERGIETIETPAEPSADSPPPPVFSTPEESSSGVVFGTPPPRQTPTAPEPTQVSGPSGADSTQPAPTPFYPWAENEHPAAMEPDSDEDARPSQQPVQRRGLFGH